MLPINYRRMLSELNSDPALLLEERANGVLLGFRATDDCPDECIFAVRGGATWEVHAYSSDANFVGDPFHDFGSPEAAVREALRLLANYASAMRILTRAAYLEAQRRYAATEAWVGMIGDTCAGLLDGYTRYEVEVNGEYLNCDDAMAGLTLAVLIQADWQADNDLESTFALCADQAEADAVIASRPLEEHARAVPIKALWTAGKRA